MFCLACDSSLVEQSELLKLFDLFQEKRWVLKEQKLQYLRLCAQNRASSSVISRSNEEVVILQNRLCLMKQRINLLNSERAVCHVRRILRGQGSVIIINSFLAFRRAGF
jgi:hypothetical protein